MNAQHQQARRDPPPRLYALIPSTALILIFVFHHRPEISTLAAFPVPSPRATHRRRSDGALPRFSNPFWSVVPPSLGASPLSFSSSSSNFPRPFRLRHTRSALFRRSSVHLYPLGRRNIAAFDEFAEPSSRVSTCISRGKRCKVAIGRIYREKRR